MYGRSVYLSCNDVVCVILVTIGFSLHIDTGKIIARNYWSTPHPPLGPPAMR